MAGKTKSLCAEQLRTHLTRAAALRSGINAKAGDAQDRLTLRAFQAMRLARTHADLLASPRYGLAANFFLTDLYGPKDFSARDAEVERILPTLLATLPAAAVQTLALAIEVDALSEELDAAMVATLVATMESPARANAKPKPKADSLAKLTDERYAAAYRRCGRRELRERQLVLIHEVGIALTALAHKPLVHAALRLMRAPARLAGLRELQQFLETGLTAFQKMGGAEAFLESIVTRETLILRRLYAGVHKPFEV